MWVALGCDDSISPSAYVWTRTGKIVADDVTALPDESDALKLCDIACGITGHGDGIGILAFLDGPAPIAPADVFCGHRCGGTDRLQGCHSVFDHGCEFHGF